MAECEAFRRDREAVRSRGVAGYERKAPLAGGLAADGYAIRPTREAHRCGESSLLESVGNNPESRDVIRGAPLEALQRDQGGSGTARW